MRTKRLYLVLSRKTEPISSIWMEPAGIPSGQTVGPVAHAERSRRPVIFCVEQHDIRDVA